MNKIKIASMCFLILVVFFYTQNTFAQMEDPYLGQVPPGIIPSRFAPEIITNNFYPHTKIIISPNGDKIFWSTFIDTVNSDLALYYSEFDGKNLSLAKQDTTLEKYGVKSFVFLDDDTKILFGSIQPYDKLNGKRVYAIWRCEQNKSGWSKPEPVECTVDTNWASVGSVSINNNGDIYFSGRLEGETAKIYCSKFVNGCNQKYEPLPEIINSGIVLDPFIDPQDKYLLLAATRREDNIGIIDIYISFKDKNGNWKTPVNLGENICTRFMDRFPMVTSDGKYLFFVTSHSNHFPSTYTHYYWVDAKVIGELMPKE
ncbi:MAG: hypothetical protein A2V66_16080 [Ignavibacteria bacterium RBG_13_36_8]|nr:MAG: hypothetical protein A2V66_16080 [Ignavibacteria bacterium RBG_13_36_8]